MTTSNFTTVILKPEEGKYLTQKNDVEIQNRLLATTIALGKFDSADNYIEISGEEAEAYRAEQKKYYEEEAKKEKDKYSI